LQILAPQIPLLFMGEEDASLTPFFFFTDYQDVLADAVREGRRQEFAKFAAFADPARREAIPNPNARATFEDSVPRPDPKRGAARRAFYQRLLTVRAAEIVPRLVGARSHKAIVVGSAAVESAWCLGDGSLLTIAINLEAEGVDITAGPPGRLLFESRAGAGASARGKLLLARSTVAFLEETG
jgi:maltooligosyltrehalose trehalohydrolase